MRCEIISLCVIVICSPCIVDPGELEPSAPPGPTMKSLNEIPPTWSQKLDSTNGSVIALFAGCGSSRFECIWPGGSPIQLPQAVLDKETGLVWERSPDTGGVDTFEEASSVCYAKAVGGRMGWRLPKVEELTSLIDPTQSDPPLPSGHPFINVQSASDFYVSATTLTGNSNFMLIVGFFQNGRVVAGSKEGIEYLAWCVRGGNGYDGP